MFTHWPSSWRPHIEIANNLLVHSWKYTFVTSQPMTLANHYSVSWWTYIHDVHMHVPHMYLMLYFYLIWFWFILGGFDQNTDWLIWVGAYGPLWYVFHIVAKIGLLIVPLLLYICLHSDEVFLWWHFDITGIDISMTNTPPPPRGPELSEQNVWWTLRWDFISN